MAEAKVFTVNGVAIDLKDATAREFLNNAACKNGLFRGKHLGTYTPSTIASFFDAHKVSSGVFEDLYLGDRFSISGGNYNKEYVIVAFDPYWQIGDTACNEHHIGFMPVGGFGNYVMNDTDTCEGGVQGSKMMTTTIPDFETKLTADFNNRLVTARCLMSNAYSGSVPSGVGAGNNGASTGWAWVSRKLILPSEVQIYGSRVASSSAYDIGEGYEKLPAFNFKSPVALLGRIAFWLRAVACAGTFAASNGNGYAFWSSASTTWVSLCPLMLGK